MRNFPRLLLFLISGVLLFSSCQEDEKPLDNSALFIGYWQNMSSDENIMMVHYFTFLENTKLNSAFVFLDADSDDLLDILGDQVELILC